MITRGVQWDQTAKAHFCLEDHQHQQSINSKFGQDKKNIPYAH